jgi:catechol 2,3-dioxygenase-like lactoylglutathione lyase family enzyme
MLGDYDALATVAVKDLAAARKFYGQTLGLEEAPGTENPEVVTYLSGRSKILVYRSPFAGSNKATSATWIVADDLETIVHALREKGVTFEHYDLPGLARSGDIHSAPGLSVVWLKDPDGNILSVLTPG